MPILRPFVLTVATATLMAATAAHADFLVLDTGVGTTCPAGYARTDIAAGDAFPPFDVNADGSICLQRIANSGGEGGAGMGGLGQGGALAAGLGGLLLVGVLAGSSSGSGT